MPIDSNNQTIKMTHKTGRLSAKTAIITGGVAGTGKAKLLPFH
jgi:hypothetical protein